MSLPDDGARTKFRQLPTSVLLITSFMFCVMQLLCSLLCYVMKLSTLTEESCTNWKHTDKLQVPQTCTGVYVL